MARKKKQVEQNPYSFDTSAKYRLPMLPKGEYNRIYQNEVKNVSCNIEVAADGAVKAYAPGYQDKWFVAQYFDWLLYTGYVKKEK